MDKKKKNIIIGSVILAFTGIGFFIWNLHNKKKEQLANDSKGSENNLSEDKPKQTDSNTSVGVSSPTNPVVNIDSKPKNVLDFQKWANKQHSASLVEDGLWGKNTSSAWTKWGSEYTKMTNLIDFSEYIKNVNKNPIGKSIYAKLTGGDVFDGATLDSVFNKSGKKTIKDQYLGLVAKYYPTATGYFVVFKNNTNKFFKIHSSNINILG